MAKRFRTIYNKVPGTLVLSETTLAWTPDEQNAEVVRNQQLSRVITMFTSKAGAKKTSLKLEFENNVPRGGLTFQFTATPPLDVSERQQVQDLLVPIIARNKERVLSGIAQTTDAEAGIKAGANALVETVGKDGRPGKTSTPSGKAVDVSKIASAVASSPTANSRAGTPTRSTPGTPVPSAGSDQTIPGGLIGPSLTPFAIQLKQSVLRKHPNLLSLHRQLVIEKLVTEAEFWDGREHLLEQERLQSTQQPGRSSQLLDDRFGFTQQAKARAERERKAKIVGTGFGIAQGSKKGASGAGADEELKIQVTKELQREIFEEFPITQRIYAENVGGEEGMTEADFWSRYFRSRLWDRHRASARAQGASGLQKVDPVFDRYLEDPDDDVEPKHAPSRAVDLFLDLAATEEDHGQTGNERDVTMQPGRQRQTLPLIRRFNEHSNRLVAQDEEVAAMAVDPEHMGSAQKRLYSEIELEDLQGESRARVIELDVQERQSFFDTKGSAVQDDMQEFVSGKSMADIRKIILSTHHGLSHWTPHLDRVIPAVPPGHPGANSGTVTVRPEATQEGYHKAKKTAEEAIRFVADALIAEEDRAAQTEPIPDRIMSQVSTCHNAACEFLRQFWSAVLPTPPGTLGGAQTPEQKAAKAKKMAGFLAGTQKKVESVVASAVNAGMKEPSRVRDALAPTLDAVNKALDQYASMK